VEQGAAKSYQILVKLKHHNSDHIPHNNHFFLA